METGANIYGTLILFAFIVGASLGALWEILRTLRLSLFQKQQFITITQDTAATKSEQNISTFRLPSQKFTISDYFCSTLPRKGVAETVFSLVSDFSFFLIAAIAVILLLFQLNLGQIRFFVPIVTALGFFIYRATLGRPLTALLVYLLRKLLGLAKRLLLLLVRPFMRLSLFIFEKIARKADARMCVSRRKKYRRRLLRTAEKGFI